ILLTKPTFMKQKFSFAICIAALAIWSCNNSSDSGTGADTTASTTATSGDTSTSKQANTNTAAATTPLSKGDSTFVMEAAVGGMMEVEAGNLAQQNGMSQRVKDFGSMMVTDHSKANSE